MDIKKTVFKASGYWMRVIAIREFVVGSILIIAGLGLAIYSRFLPPLIISLIGLFIVGWGWFSWKRAKSLIKGKFM